MADDVHIGARINSLSRVWNTARGVADESKSNGPLGLPEAHWQMPYFYGAIKYNDIVVWLSKYWSKTM